MICESEKISLQTQLFDMQANAHKHVTNKVSVEEQESLKAHEHNVEKSNVILSECRSKLEDSSFVKCDSDDSCVIINSVSNF